MLRITIHDYVNYLDCVLLVFIVKTTLVQVRRHSDGGVQGERGAEQAAVGGFNIIILTIAAISNIIILTIITISNIIPGCRLHGQVR